MSESNKLVIVVTRGFDDERASVAWTIANSGINTGLAVTVFLVSSGVDWVRKGTEGVAQLLEGTLKPEQTVEHIMSRQLRNENE